MREKPTDANPATKLTDIMTRLYRNRYTTTSGGNLSVKSEDGNVYITPGSLDKGALREEHIVRIAPTGEKVGIAPPSCEWPFHLNIYKIHPEYTAIVHAHPGVLMGYSLAHRVPRVEAFPLVWDSGKIAVAGYGAPGSERLMTCVGEAFRGDITAAIMTNHGAVVGHTDGLGAAYSRFEDLIFCAECENASLRWNSGLNIPSDSESNRLKEFFAPEEECLPAGTEMFWAERGTLTHWIRRAYEQRLLLSRHGTISLRVGEDAFLINRRDEDRAEVSEKDLVLVSGGKMYGGQADATWQLHRDIYLANPALNAAFTAYCPNIMGVLAGDKLMDTDCMPESFIVLHSLPAATIGQFLDDPRSVTGRISAKQHISCLKNGFVLTAGSSLKEAFDTLEVAEFSAQAALEAAVQGGVCPLPNADVEEMRQLFGID